MIPIKLESINVHQIFDEAFIELTRKIASIELAQAEDEPFDAPSHLFLIKTRGVFRGAICTEIEEGLMEELVTRINNGRKLLEPEKILFAMEYLNIVCGRALSEINDQVGDVSRLTVPYHVTGKTAEDLMKEGDELERITYNSEYGRIRITVTYNYESKR